MFNYKRPLNFRLYQNKNNLDYKNGNKAVVQISSKTLAKTKLVLTITNKHNLLNLK